LENEILERHRIEVALRASEATYRILFENISVMCVVYDRSSKVVLVNQPMARFLGTTPEALQGKNLQDILPAAYVEQIMQQQAQVWDTGTTEVVEGKIVLPDGKEFYYLRHIVLLPYPTDSLGRAARVLVITTDLTEQKRAEQRERELILAKEKNIFLTDFLNTVSHDLKTPGSDLRLSRTAGWEERRKQDITS
jgi:PAS domain S-box-containing protein